jgi:hypothetical protein
MHSAQNTDMENILKAYQAAHAQIASQLERLALSGTCKTPTEQFLRLINKFYIGLTSSLNDSALAKRYLYALQIANMDFSAYINLAFPALEDSILPTHLRWEDYCPWNQSLSKGQWINLFEKNLSDYRDCIHMEQWHYFNNLSIVWDVLCDNFPD